MTRTTNTVALGTLFALIPPLIWGGMFPVANSLLPTVNAFHMTLIRYVTVAAILVTLLLVIEGARHLRFDDKIGTVFWLGAMGFAGFGLLAFTALEYTSATNVSLLMAMMPVISMIIGALAARRMPPTYSIATILVALAGVSVVITRGDYAALLAGEVGLGELLALAGAICWVIYTQGVAQFPTWSPLRYTTLTTSLGCISIATATLVVTAVGYVSAPTVGAVLAGWPQLAYLIVFAGVIAVFSWAKGIGLLGALNGTLFMNLVPVTTFTIVIAAGYRPGLLEIVGALVVIGALVINNLAARRAAARVLAQPAGSSHTAQQGSTAQAMDAAR